MCYRKHSAVLEFLSYCILNQGICFHINTCCSFINTEYLKNKIFVFYFITLKICHLIISQWTKLHFILCFREMILLREKSSFIEVHVYVLQIWSNYYMQDFCRKLLSVPSFLLIWPLPNTSAVSVPQKTFCPSPPRQPPVRPVSPQLTQDDIYLESSRFPHLHKHWQGPSFLSLTHWRGRGLVEWQQSDS